MTEGLYYEDFTVGREWITSARTVTVCEIMTYAGLSGDFHPLHVDEEYARRTEFGGRIAHGPLLIAIAAGLINRLSLVDGTGIALLGLDDVRLLKPVKPGDTIHVRVEVVEQIPTSKPERGVVKRLTEIINQRDEVVLRMMMLYLMKRRH